MFGIMNSVIRVATRSDLPAAAPRKAARQAQWPHRAAIERSQSLRAEACSPAPQRPKNS